MDFIKKYPKISIAVALIIAIVFGFYLGKISSKQGFGGVTAYDEVDATAIKIGTNGSRLGQIIQGTCTLIVSNGGGASMTSTSTPKAVDCAVTGVVSGDTVQMWFATTTVNPAVGSVGAAYKFVASAASTTSGFITGIVENDNGTTAVLSSSGIATTVGYTISHPVSAVPGL